MPGKVILPSKKPSDEYERADSEELKMMPNIHTVQNCRFYNPAKPISLLTVRIF